MNLMTEILCLLFLLTFVSITYAEKPKNYCKDPNSWVEWEDLIEKYPGDVDIQLLHALRIGLCIKIEKGSISFEKANRIFNRAHEIVILKKKEEKEKRRGNLNGLRGS